MRGIVKTLSATAILSAALLVSGAARADVILSNAEAGAYAGAITFQDGNFDVAFSTYIYTDPDNNLVTASQFATGTAGDNSTWFTGGVPGATSITITAADGGTFTLNSFDAAALVTALRTPQIVTSAYDSTDTQIGSSDFTNISSSSGATYDPTNLAGVVMSELVITGDFLVSDGSSTAQAGVANVDVSEVPEPASMALLGSGLAALGFLRRRRRA